MPKSKYGLIEDIEKFNDTNGEEGVQEIVVKDEVVKDEVVKDEVVKDEVVKDEVVKEFKIEENADYIALQTELSELKGKTIPEINPHLKEIDEWAKRTNRPVEDWIKFQSDPSKLSDEDIVRKTQRLKNPTLGDDELDFLYKKKFVSDEDEDTESDVMSKKIAFKQEVASGKELLESNRLKFDTKLDMNLSEDQKKDIAFAQKVREDRTSQSTASETDLKNLQTVTNSTDKIPLKLNDKKTIDFNITPESKKDQVNYIGEMKRWQNEDGSVNSQNLLEDSYKLKHFDEIIDVVYKQGQNDQIENSAKENANITDPDLISQEKNENKYGLVAGRGRDKRYQV